MRESVVTSLTDLCVFLEPYNDGNDFGDKYTELQFTRPQVITLFLDTDDEGNVIHRPTLAEIDSAFTLACDRIMLGAYGLPRVESNIFADDGRIAHDELTLKTGDVQDESNGKAKAKLLHAIKQNKVGAIAFHRAGNLSPGHICSSRDKDAAAYRCKTHDTGAASRTARSETCSWSLGTFEKVAS